MTLPNFLIIGAAKSGTSALYYYIKDHPNIFMATPKELRFFSSFLHPEENGPDVYKNKHATSIQEYEKYFECVNQETAIGEASPQYLYYLDSARYIKEILPNVKIISMLRNPVDRAYSSYLHAVRDWFEDSKNFKQGLQREEKRIDSGWPMLFHYINGGYYYQQLKQYYDLFPSENIKTIIYDDFVNSPESILREIFLFLQVDQNYVPDMSFKPNVSGQPRWKLIHRFLKPFYREPSSLQAKTKKIIPKSIRATFSSKIKKINQIKVPLDSTTRQSLIKLFEEDILLLQNLLNRDLSIWLEIDNN